MDSFQSTAVNSNHEYSIQFTVVDSDQCIDFCALAVRSIQFTALDSDQCTDFCALAVRSNSVHCSGLRLVY